MSKSRQPLDASLIRTFAVTFNDSELVPPRSESWDQLVYALKGVVSVETESGTWFVPPHRGVWLPANTAHTLHVSGQTALRMLYLRRAKRSTLAGEFDRSRCSVVSVSPLLRELIRKAVGIGALLSADASHRRLAGVIFDEIRTIDTVPLQLPMPRDIAARSFASKIGRDFDLAAAVQECGASRRTLERVFLRETGMSLGQWIRRRKIFAAMTLLLSGETTASVAYGLNYSSPSAFIAMFKKELGETPARYLEIGRAATARDFGQKAQE